MKKQTVKEISKQEHYTLLLDEATDESNRSELSLIARVVENSEIKNHFLSLLELWRGDTESVFKTVGFHGQRKLKYEEGMIFWYG